MEFKELSNLKRRNGDELYNLNIEAYNFNAEEINKSSSRYITTDSDEMRMDNISNKLYKSPNHVDFICRLNNIKNPLTIKKDLELIYVPLENISAFGGNSADRNNEIRREISNKRKETKPDPNREDYLETKRQSLPPTITKQDYSGVDLKNGKLSIGSNIFNI